VEGETGPLGLSEVGMWIEFLVEWIGWEEGSWSTLVGHPKLGFHLQLGTQWKIIKFYMFCMDRRVRTILM
jgi:hypothetical protein